MLPQLTTDDRLPGFAGAGLTRAIDRREHLEIDVLEEELRPPDVWLLCSDGLHAMVEEAEGSARRG